MSENNSSDLSLINKVSKESTSSPSSSRLFRRGAECPQSQRVTKTLAKSTQARARLLITRNLYAIYQDLGH